MLDVERLGGVMCLCYVIFFFKQKTAYEMRISDWSSDVCSSDLAEARRGPGAEAAAAQYLHARAAGPARRTRADPPSARDRRSFGGSRATQSGSRRAGRPCARRDRRSEENTSEHQSLMPIAYAVACLKNKHNISIIIESQITHKTNHN